MNETHIFPAKDFPVVPEEDRVEWTKGDLVTVCHNCGNVDVVAKEIESGIQAILPVDNHNEIRLVCSNCNSALSLRFNMSEGAEIKVPEDKEDDKGMKEDDKELKASTDEVVNEETKEEKENEPQTESK